MKQKNKNLDFSVCCQVQQGASLLGNSLGSKRVKAKRQEKGVMKAGEGTIRAGEDTIRTSQHF